MHPCHANYRYCYFSLHHCWIIKCLHRPSRIDIGRSQQQRGVDGACTGRRKWIEVVRGRRGMVTHEVPNGHQAWCVSQSGGNVLHLRGTANKSFFLEYLIVVFTPQRRTQSFGGLQVGAVHSSPPFYLCPISPPLSSPCGSSANPIQQVRG